MSLDKIVALVPMRHDSVRVPGKNYRPIAGKPLYHHILETLLACPEISRVVVDTDSPVILDGLAKDFPSVTALLLSVSGGEYGAFGEGSRFGYFFDTLGFTPAGPAIELPGAEASPHGDTES